MSKLSHAGEPAWTVTVAPDSDADSVARSLQGIGFTVFQVLDAIGVIMVRGSEALAAKARRIEGVTDVSKEISIDIGPPHSEIS